MRLLVALIALFAAYLLGRIAERVHWMSDDDSYRAALIRRLLDSDIEIQMEVPRS